MFFRFSFTKLFSLMFIHPKGEQTFIPSNFRLGFGNPSVALPHHLPDFCAGRRQPFFKQQIFRHFLINFLLFPLCFSLGFGQLFAQFECIQRTKRKSFPREEYILVCYGKKHEEKLRKNETETTKTYFSDDLPREMP